MKGIIFDMDGVLVDAMPFHAEAMRIAINEETGYDIDKKIVYLLEGMPGPGLIKEIFKREKINKDIDDILAEKINKRKKELFKQIQNSQAIEGAKQLIKDLRSCNCLKAIVSGASKKEIEAILDDNIGLKNFNVVIAGDDIEEGKPHPSPFQTALQRMDLKPSEAIVVENAPLGVEAAIRAGIEYIVTLNNTPLDISSDFKDTISFNEKEKNKLFKDTKSASSFLKEWCCN
jgi:beta-phosphoglucomutase